MTEKTPNLGGRPKFQPTDEQRAQVQAMAVFGHKSETIAEFIGISHPTLQKHFGEELRKARMVFDAQAVASLYKAIRSGESWAVQYYLRTKGKAFGWSERIILDTHNDPFKGVDMTRLNKTEFLQFMRLLEKAGANLTLDEQEVMQAKSAIALPMPH